MAHKPEYYPSFPVDQVTVTSIRETTRIEVIPLPSLHRQLDDIPAGSRLSVTCSPSHGLTATIDLVAALRERGHDAIPHIAAKQVNSRAQLAEMAARLDGLGVSEIFVVGGDAQSDGPYEEALDVAIDYKAFSSAVRGFGFTAYPDGHVSISNQELLETLKRKHEFVTSSGVYGYVSSQMCFDGPKITDWLISMQQRGGMLPLRLGIPGRVDRLKLASISARLGVGNSLKFLRKNKSMAKLMTSAHFEPTELVNEVLGGSYHGLEGFHVFSFNNVAPTFNWLDRYMDSIEGRARG